MKKVKDKEIMLKEAREKQLLTYKGAPIRLSADFSTETLQVRRMARNIQIDKKEGPTTKITLPGKVVIQYIRGLSRRYPVM